jgi:arylsulfatase A-like enzyme
VTASVVRMETTHDIDGVVVVLLDSLNRHMLGPWGGTEFDTPHIDRLAAQSVVFDNHHVGSLPCIPARHDLMVGALDFLWRPWGSIEVWEEAVTAELRRCGVTSVLVSDHPHLFETGGENYHTDFTAWEYLRGSENDPWRTRADTSSIGAAVVPAVPAPFHRPYDDARTWFRNEEDFPGPRTMEAAAQWLRRDAPHHERFLLVVDEFDPHEPFDTPEPWASRYDPDWDGPRMIWPPYAVNALANGVLTERELQHLRAGYGGGLSMIDHWFGRILDAVDELDALGRRVAVILCTDHGLYLGERDIVGKPGAPLWPEMSRIPLMIRWPGVPPRRCEALTTTVDLHATICDVFGVVPEHRTDGASLRPLLNGEVSAIRDYVLAGYWSRHVHYVDAEWSYSRSAVGDAFPLAMWSNRWSSMPIDHAVPGYRFPRPDGRATLERYPGTGVPVIRQPWGPGDRLPYWAMGMPVDDHHLHHTDDVDRSVNLLERAGGVESDVLERLRSALMDVGAPPEQFERLGIA